MDNELVKTYVIPIALRILLAIAIWIVGRWLARRSRGWLTKSLKKTDLTESFVVLITTVSYFGILILAGLLALAALGVPVAALGAALSVVIIVLAITLQTSLGNLAATIMILLFKPFKVGDVIEAGGVLGVVHEIQMFSTVLNSPDGKTHILPNGLIQGGGVANHSTSGKLRLDLRFGVSYDSDLEKAKAVLSRLLATDERVLSEPPARVFVGQLGDSAVELVASPFVETGDYATVLAEFVEQAKRELDAAGIDLPNPQQDVHLYTHN